MVEDRGDYLINDNNEMIVKHTATWVDHDYFTMRSDVGTMVNCDEHMLRFVKDNGMHVEFINERPPAPTRWERFWAWLRK